MKNFLLAIMFVLIGTAAAGASMVVQDTTYPVGVVTDQWSGTTPHVEQIDEVDACGLNDSIYVTASGIKYFSYNIAVGNDSRFFPWVDSAHFEVCAFYRGVGMRKVVLGQGKSPEGTFAWCGSKTAFSTAKDTPTLYFKSILRDTCNASSWNAYYVVANIGQWALATEGLSTGILRVTKSDVVWYSTYPDTLPGNVKSYYFVQPSALLCSTWAAQSCNNTDSCLKGFYADFRTDGTDLVHAWTITNPVIPYGTKIDSFQGWWSGIYAPGYNATVDVGYVVKTGSTCDVYGTTTLTFTGAGANDGAFQKVTWVNCPATNKHWTLDDLINSSKGFCVKSKSGSYVAFDWWRGIVFVSLDPEQTGVFQVKKTDRPGRLAGPGLVKQIYKAK